MLPAAALGSGDEVICMHPDLPSCAACPPLTQDGSFEHPYSYLLFLGADGQGNMVRPHGCAKTKVPLSTESSPRAPFVCSTSAARWSSEVCLRHAPAGVCHACNLPACLPRPRPLA